MIIEKYLRDESKHKDRDIATIHFYIVLNNIYVQYQYGEGQITQSKRIFEKPTVADYKDFDPASVTENIVYPYEGHLEPYESYMLLQEMIEAEIEAIRAISKLEDEVIGILESRSRERSECKLKINSLDWDRNRKTRKLLQIKVVIDNNSYIFVYCYVGLFFRKIKNSPLSSAKRLEKQTMLCRISNLAKQFIRTSKF